MTNTPTRRAQFSLLTILLLIASAAVWMAFYSVSQDVQRMHSQLPGLRDVARELVIKDTQQYAAVFKAPTRWNEFIWNVYLPPVESPQKSYKLCLAMDEIDETGLVDALASVAVGAGTHEIELRYQREKEQARLEVLVDGKPVTDEARPLDWESGSGSSGASQMTTSISQSVDEPLVLFRRRFMRKTSKQRSSVPNEPSEGILIWIDHE